MPRILALLVCGLFSTLTAVGAWSLDAAGLAILMNRQDPLSVSIARHYQQVRGVPDDALIALDLEPDRAVLDETRFARLKARIDALTPKRVQAYAVAWTEPYRVGCMSLTSALAFGFDPAYCSRPCNPTRASTYFDSDTRTPYRTLGIRPSMMLAGRDEAQLKALIARGLSADRSQPRGSAYLLMTSDERRSVRQRFFPRVLALAHEQLRVRILKADRILGKRDVMMYFTGLTHVEGLDSLGFLPGAVADHLTSSGGVLAGSRQMSVLAWLEAGATGSYGTVVEPCAYTQKFPRPDVLVRHYLAGETLLEAYWKSVEWPGEGVFVGEPLASPWAH
ncbi:MAG: TIGR03790 family protein [Gammaproteobacteria bacterium]|nr:TIGR03790 family protein [Gammaproteobacteria bacterium]